MKIYCLSCTNDWNSRGNAISRQCPYCWGRSLATEDELRLGSLVCHMLANLASGGILPLPSPSSLPGDAISFPFSLKTYHDIMSRAGDQSQRRRAVQLMLEQRGLNPQRSSGLANSMFP
jgi:hypothetical protein